MNPEQFKEKVLPLRGQLLSYAKRLLDDSADAEDVVQDVYLKLWYMRVELDNYRNIPALSVQITKNLCLNKIKNSRRTHESLDGLAMESRLLPPDTQLEEKDSVAYLMRIIDRLPENQRTVLRMKHVDGFEVEEIASITGSAPEAIRMNLSRARKKIREIFFNMEKR
ncbi:MAG: sigma-70 family RNA polymerase sigma factor [Tannerella sp.]|jgi:RNA polymerase sigma-70 factor (ECF subfamily)|nr:sigma-70 family RNA polymerase sigma factor [Tannerella sp.]